MYINKKSSSGYYQNQPELGGIVSKLSWYARQKMFNSLIELAQPSSFTKVLDVGVTSDQRKDSNFFEKLYPYPSSITAIGLEDAAFLENAYPGLKYIRFDGHRIPFPDKSFDLVVCFAVIEHVGSRDRQHRFVAELCRVSRTCYMTTPNRWHPVEFHTVLPLVHWLPVQWFRRILKALGKNFWSKENNLNLLSRKDILTMIPQNYTVIERHCKLFGVVSNLVFYFFPSSS